MPLARLWLARIALIFLAWGSPGLAGAQELQRVPPLAAHVIDATGTLDGSQKQALDARLAAFEQAKGSQLVFLMVPTTQPEDIASYANRVASTWKIGRKDVGDGLLLVVAKNDRKLRIEVAKALEGAVPDLAAKQIIDDALTPAFKRGDYAGGLDAAATQLMARVSGEALPAPAPQQGGARDDGFDWMDLAIFVFFAIPLIATAVRGIFGRKLGALLTGGGVGAVALFITGSLLVAAGAALAGLLVALFSNFGGLGSAPVRRHWGTGGWSTGGGGGGWSSGSDGGGFSSGGGGDFGGGGASGDW
ncbi:MAG: TPM domain-containing protein [Ramlibacter sp.]|nr:TPM domain-containing protein [Ramlibacter sp.]